MFTFKLAVFIQIHCHLFTFSAPPATVTIGGLFPFWQDGVIDWNTPPQYRTYSGNNTHRSWSGNQHLAAFVMAIREVNNKSDGIFDWLLPNTEIIFSVQPVDDTYISTIFGVLNVYYMGASGVVGPPAYYAADQAAQFYGDQFISLPVISYGVTSPDFSDGALYSTMLRTSFSDSYQGRALAEIVNKNFGWSRVSLFYSLDTYGTHASNTFTQYAAALGISVVSTHTFLAGTTDYTTIINSAKSAKTYIFVFIMSAHDAGLLLERGYNAGLFREGTQVIGGDRVVTEETYQSMSSQAKVPTIMKGVLGITPYFGFDSPQGQAFVKRWRAQSPTVIYNPDGSQTCDFSDFDSFYDYSVYSRNYVLSLYAYVDLFGGVHCTGFDFQRDFTKEDGSDIDGLVASTYDATIALLMAFHLRFQDNTVDSLNGILNSIVSNNVSFTGLTGPVSFVGGKRSDDHRGDRKTGITYNVLNFNAKAYKQNNETGGGFVPVGRWVSETGFKYCSGSKSCNAIRFNTADNSVPKDRPDTVIVSMSAAVKNALIALGAICAVIVLGFLVMTVYFRKEMIVRGAQPPMLYVILVGGFVGAARVFLGSVEVTDTICIVKVWCGHLCFGLVFAALISKTWVVNKLVNSGLKRVKVSKKDTVINLFAVLGILVIFLAIITALGKPHQTYEYTYDGDVPYRSQYCSNNTTLYSELLLVIEALTALVGVRLAWAIRAVPDALNESKFIFAGNFISF